MNITYYLGAGASADAIPIVEMSNPRMELFLFCLRKGLESSEFVAENWELVQQKINEYHEIYRTVKYHLSYDTYAKKLWLQEKDDELLKLKELISLFYFFEHGQNKFVLEYAKVFKSKNYSSNDKFIEEYVEGYKDQIDKRYDAFFAGIATKHSVDNFFLPPNINIISWNYDLQVEMALNSYGKNSMECSFNPYKLSEKDQSISKSNFIKLNGSCGFTKGFSYDNKLDLNRYFDSISLLSLKDYYKIIADLTVKKSACEPHITFAWEEDDTKLIINKAMDIMEQTEGLVVIGYSFPLFNRDIDKKLFGKLRLADNSKIYIQTKSNDEFESIRSRIKGIIKIGDEKIVFIPDIKQFFVPFELNEMGKFEEDPVARINQSAH